MTRPEFPSDRWKRIDDLIDDWSKALAITGAVGIGMLIGVAVFSRIFGGAS